MNLTEPLGKYIYFLSICSPIDCAFSDDDTPPEDLTGAAVSSPQQTNCYSFGVTEESRSYELGSVLQPSLSCLQKAKVRLLIKTTLAGLPEGSRVVAAYPMREASYISLQQLTIGIGT